MDIFIAYSSKSNGCHIVMVLSELQATYKNLGKFELKKYHESLMANKTIGGKLSDVNNFFYEANI